MTVNSCSINIYKHAQIIPNLELRRDTTSEPSDMCCNQGKMPKSFTAAVQVFLMVLSNVFQLTRSASSLQSKQGWPKQRRKRLHGLSPAFSNLIVEPC